MTLNNKLTKLLINNRKLIKYTFITLLGLTAIVLYVKVLITVGEISYNKALQLPPVTTEI